MTVPCSLITRNGWDRISMCYGCFFVWLVGLGLVWVLFFFLLCAAKTWAWFLGCRFEHQNAIFLKAINRLIWILNLSANDSVPWLYFKISRRWITPPINSMRTTVTNVLTIWSWYHPFFPLSNRLKKPTFKIHSPVRCAFFFYYLLIAHIVIDKEESTPK